MHSGLQAIYGFPWYSVTHSHIASTPETLQFALGPQGDGEQGFLGAEGGAKK